MALGSSELERLSEDIYKERIILGAVYCGGCGYNLRTLPYLYTCPECGREYDARPRKMKGIFNPNTISFPLRDGFWAILSMAAAVWLGVPAVREVNGIALGFSALFLIFAIFSGRYTYKGIVRYLQAFSILRRIQEEEKAAE